jgi:hypothetical protein
METVFRVFLIAAAEASHRTGHGGSPDDFLFAVDDGVDGGEVDAAMTLFNTWVINNTYG